MFNLSKKVDYGLQLMVFLAKSYQKGRFSLRQIAKEEKLPFKFLEQMAIPLREAGLIEAKEGRGGGYSLKKPPEKISMAKIVEVLEGPLEIGHCFGCPNMGMCEQKDVWNEVGDKVRKTIEGKTLEDLIQK